MDDLRWERYAAVGGIVFVVANVVGVFLPGTPPSPSDSATKIAAFFHDHSGGIEAAQVLGGIGVIGLAWWFGSLWRLMTRAEDGRPRMAIVALVGFAVSGGLALLSGAITSATALRADDIGDGARVFYTLSTVVISTSGFGLVVFLAAYSSLNYRKSMLPQWTTYLGWLAALGFLVASFGSASDSTALGFIGLGSFLVWCVWIIGISAFMWRGEGQTAPAA
jgi:hypothetical protein